MSNFNSVFRVSKIFGAYYEIYSFEEGIQLATLRGKLRLSAKKERHPFVVGDLVYATKSDAKWVIDSQIERKSILYRKSSAKDAHALCSNADYAVLIASLKEPETKSGFIDRFLAAVSISGMTPILVFNKTDLVSESTIDAMTSYYKFLGYKVFLVSMMDSESIHDLKNFLKGKVSFLSGNSGVGKSTIVNLLTDSKVQSTQIVSESTQKGKHTTTNSSAIFLEDGTIFIDSPGIKEWGILHLDREDLLMSFPEFRMARESCESEFCCDLKEEGCKIQEIFTQIPEERSKSMESMLESLESPFRTTRRDHWNRADRKESY
jgi:ribosome biogenesis GTPase